MHRYKAQNHLVPNGTNVTTLEQRSSPKSTRCMRGVLWRISHVQELLHILPGETGQREEHVNSNATSCYMYKKLKL